MFIRKENKYLPKHIKYYTFRKKEGPITEEDKKEIQDFYNTHNINYRGLTDSHHSVIFKRTINYIYIVAHFFAKNPNAKNICKIGKDIGKGVVRTQAYIFHKSGRILYELDHDYREQPKDTFGHSQVKHQKMLKRNYDLHDELNNSNLNKVGRLFSSFVGFDKACHTLLHEDNTPQSIDFITGD